MKRRFNILKSFALAATGLLAMTSCSENSFFSTATEPTKGKVALQLSLSNSSDTRVLEGSTLPDDCSYKIFALTENGELLNKNSEGATVNFRGGVSTIVGDTIYLPEDGSNVNVVALYNTEGYYNGNGEIVKIPFRSGIKDYLLGNSIGTVNNSNPKATIQFKHFMSRIRLNITKPADALETYRIPTITIDKVKDQAALRITQHADKHEFDWISEGTTAFYTKPEGNTTLAAATDTVSVDFIVLPTLQEGVKIRIDSLKKSFTLPVSDFKEGEQYTFNVNINKKQVEEVKEHEYVDLGLPSGTLWATHNLDLNQDNLETSAVEKYGSYVNYGDPTGRKEIAKDSLITPESLYPDSIFGTQYDIAFVQWGKDWRLPTREEAYELRSKCTFEFTEVNGVNCAKAIGPNGNYIILPMGGYSIYPYFSVEELGTGAYFWTGEIYQGDRKYVGWSPIRTNTVNEHGGWAYGCGIYYKCHVRPVRNK